MNQQQQRKDQAPTPENSRRQPAQQNAIATKHLENMAADLEKIKKTDQLLKTTIAEMAQNPALSGGEKKAAVLIESIQQQSGE